jgi:hypothetical protein
MSSEIFSQDNLRAKLNQGQNINIYKAPLINTDKQRYGKIIDVWTATGNPNAGGSFTSNGSILNKQTTGALQFRDSAEGKNLYLADVNFYSSWKNVTDNNGTFLTNISTGLIHVWDRLWQNGGLNFNTSYIITQPSLTRYTAGDSLSLWFREYTLTSPIAITNFSVTYKNQNNQSNIVKFDLSVNNGIAGSYDVFAVPLLSGDTGIRQVESVSTTSATAGTYGLFIGKYYGAFPFVVQNGFPVSNSLLNTLQQIDNNACLTFGIQMAGRAYDSVITTQHSTTGTSMPSLMGNIRIIEA